MRMFLADGEEELARELILATYPDPRESCERLAGAGWQFIASEWGTGRPFRLLLTDGRQVLLAEGRNEAEAAFQAVRQALEEKLPMMLPIAAVPVPLSDDGRGGIRIGECLFPLDVLIREYEKGTDPRGIVKAYPVLQLPDVHAVIAYYLRYKDEVTAYLKRREEEAAAMRREIESSQPPSAELKAKLLARRAQQEQDHATTRG
jgi:uncharacterized protein (DUF433 family)